MRADGNCLYHVAATALLCLRDPGFLKAGAAPCYLALVKKTREKTARNFEVWAATFAGRPKLLKATLDLVFNQNQTATDFLREVRGGAWGGAAELALCLGSAGIAVACLRSNSLSASSTPETCCEIMSVLSPGDPKFVVVAVWVGAKHYDLGVVSSASWHACCQKIIDFAREARHCHVASHGGARFLKPTHRAPPLLSPSPRIESHLFFRSVEACRVCWLVG